jgi:hypothetical protein
MDNDTDKEVRYGGLAWTLSKGKTMKNERNDK